MEWTITCEGVGERRWPGSGVIMGKAVDESGINFMTGEEGRWEIEAGCVGIILP